MKIWRGLIVAITVITIAVCLIMVVMINLDVFARTVLGRPIPLAVELTTFGFALTTFLPLVLVAQEGREIAFDMVRTRISRRANLVIRTLYSLAGAAVILVILWSVWNKFLWALRVGDYIPSSPLLYTAVPWGAIALGLLLYALEMLRIAFVSIASIVRREDGRKEENGA